MPPAPGNLIEIWFGDIEGQAIHRGTFGSVRDLNAKIRPFITSFGRATETTETTDAFYAPFPTTR